MLGQQNCEVVCKNSLLEELLKCMTSPGNYLFVCSAEMKPNACMSIL